VSKDKNINNERQKFLLLIPDGAGIRNFLFGSFIDRLLSTGEVLIWHALPEKSIVSYKERWSRAVRWELLPTFREGLIERVLRQAKIYAQLYWRYDADNSDAALKFLRPSGRFLNHAVAFISRNAGRILASSSGAIWLDKQHARASLRSGQFERFKAFLSRERPNVVFCTHQRASRAVPAMLAARELGIPTATFVYSWDNLPKGRMAVHADHFFVWSDLMKDEMLRYYPEVIADRIHVVGTPQFEHHHNKSLLQPRETFLRHLGLDPSRPVICFSGDDIPSSPHDPMYLADLAASLRKTPAPERPQIIFRRCPVDTSDRYRWVIEKYPEIVVSEPLWLPHSEGDWTQIIPTREDLDLLVNIVHHSDTVINVGSTMAMDFAVLDKPAIYLAYNPPAVNGNSSWTSESFYRLPHFRSVFNLQPIYWAKGPEDLGRLVMHVLEQSQEKSHERREWLNQMVALPLDQASDRCYEALRKVAASSNGNR
jgi:hypothetical protein